MKKSALLITGLFLLLGLLVLPGAITRAACTDPSCPVPPGDVFTNPEGNTIPGDLTGNNNDNVIINDGTVNGSIVARQGDDYIENNGTVQIDINGGGGNDTILVNGTVQVDVTGGAGDDTITVNGTVHGVVRGNDGSDTVIIQGGAQVDGLLRGGLDDDPGFDTLTFDMVLHDYNQYTSAINQLASQLPSSGSATINGVYFEWRNFEELVNAISYLFLPNLSGLDAEEDGALLPVYRDYKEVESGVVAYLDLALLPTELFTSVQFTNGETPDWLVDLYYVSNDYYGQHYMAYQVNIYGPDGLYSDTQMLLISHVDGSVILFEREW